MSDRVKRNVEDVDYATADGNRPMRTVLRELAVKRRKYSRAQLDAAYRTRARDIAVLQHCLCCFPSIRAATKSGHEEWCPSEHLRRSFEAVDARMKTTNNKTETKGTNDGP